MRGRGAGTEPKLVTLNRNCESACGVNLPDDRDDQTEKRSFWASLETPSIRTSGHCGLFGDRPRRAIPALRNCMGKAKRPLTTLFL